MEEDLKAMFRVCVHIKKDGIRCNSPALSGGNFCFQHIGGSLREHTRARSIYRGPQLDFLYPGTRQAIQNNLFVVAQAMNDGNLELATANSYNRIFSACERNLRRFELLYQKSGPDVEFPEVPEEAPEKKAPNPDGNQRSTAGSVDQLTGIVIPTEVSGANEAEEPACSESPNDVILSGATAGSKVEGPAFSSPSHRIPENTKAPSVSPESEPLELTPEEIARFDELESRYINDPTFADRIRDTYHDIREQRRNAKKQASASQPTTEISDQTQIVIPAEESAANEAEEPALSNPTNDVIPGRRERANKAEEPTRSLVPGPCSLTPA